MIIDHLYTIIESEAEYFDLQSLGFRVMEVGTDTGTYKKFFISFDDTTYLEFIYPYSEEGMKRYTNFWDFVNSKDHFIGLSFGPSDGQTIVELKNSINESTGAGLQITKRGYIDTIEYDEVLGDGNFSWITAYPGREKWKAMNHPNGCDGIFAIIISSEFKTELGRDFASRLGPKVINHCVPGKSNQVSGVILSRKQNDFVFDAPIEVIGGIRVQLIREMKSHQFDIYVRV